LKPLVAVAVNYLVNGVQTAASLPNVSVVTMSFGFGEFSGETSYDSYFNTPAGHGGVTFVSSTGDQGTPADYPAFSPNVLAVGGTTLTISGNNYGSETGYNSSGGGISNYENKPGYQSNLGQSLTLRTTPDVSFDGNPNTGVAVYDSYNGGYPGWYKIAGTSFAAPAWAGLIAIANQGRAGDKMAPLDGPTQTLPRLYSLPASDFHDITTGNNGYPAGTGYDLVSGIGTPIANLLIPALAGVPTTGTGTGSISGTVSKVVSGSTSVFSGVTVYLDTNGNTALDSGEPSTTTSSSGTFSFSGLPANTYHLREVVPSGYTQTSPGSSPTNVTVGTTAVSGENFTDTAITTSGSLLKGTVIGTSGSYQNDGNTIVKAFDGSLSTYFDGPTASGNWAGMNLGGQNTITQIRYSPRPNWGSRMVGGIFQGSNDPNFATGVTNLATITSTPTVGVYSVVGISNTNTFQYVRYLSPANSWGDVAEIQFYGIPATATHPKLTGTVIGTAGSYQNDGNTIAKAFDGSLSTYFDGPTASGNWAGRNLGAQYTITQINYSPRVNWAGRMVGGIFQGSNDPNFVNGVVNLATITTTPTVGVYTPIPISNTSTFQYVRYLSPANSWGDVAEIQFYGIAAAHPKLSGTVIGTAGSYQNDGNTIAKAFDGSLSTYFDGPTANGNWAGLDLGTAHSIGQISYAPRANWAGRMVGGIFQASNTADFSSVVVNLFTITATPPYNALSTVGVSASGTYRYVRYLSPANSWGDVSEVQFFG